MCLTNARASHSILSFSLAIRSESRGRAQERFVPTRLVVGGPFSWYDWTYEYCTTYKDKQDKQDKQGDANN